MPIDQLADDPEGEDAQVDLSPTHPGGDASTDEGASGQAPDAGATEGAGPDSNATGSGNDGDIGGDGDHGATDTGEPGESWRQPFEELGFRDIESPEQAQQRALETIRQQREQLRQAQEEAAYNRSLVARLGQPGQQPSGQAQSAPEPDPEPADPFEAASQNWLDPQTAQAIAQHLTVDESGNRAWAEGTPQHVRQRYEQFQQQQHDWAQVIGNPQKLAEAIDQRVERMFQDRLESTLTERESQMADDRAKQEFFAENDWIYEKDPLTGATATDFSGNPVLSGEGRQFVAALREVQSNGVQGLSKQLDMAKRLYSAEKANRQTAPQRVRQQSQQQAADQRKQMLGRRNGRPPNARQKTAAGITDGNGADRTGENHESFGQRFINELKEEGYQF